MSIGISQTQINVTSSLASSGSSTSPGGVTGDIQFNASGSFAGSATTITAAGSINVPAGQVRQFNSDTGLSRYQQGVLAIGNGNQADYTGTVLVTDVNATGIVSASGTSFAVQPGTPGSTGFAGGLGYSFSVTQNVIVSRLGRKQGTGANNQNIYLWLLGNNTALVTATILTASVADSNGFKWVTISAVTLTPGNQYFISVDFQASDKYLANAVQTLQAQFQLWIPWSGSAATAPTAVGAFNLLGQIWDCAAMTYTTDTGIVNTSQYQLNGTALTIGDLPGQPSTPQLYGVALLLNSNSTQVINSTIQPSGIICSANCEVQGWLWPQGILYDNTTQPGVSGQVLTSTGSAILWSWVLPVPAKINLTAQANSIGSTVLYAVPAAGAGMYRISYYLYDTTAGSAGTVTATFGWTDDTSNAESITSASVPLTGVIGSLAQGTVTFYSKASVNITYLTTVTGALGSPQYALRARVEYLG